MLGSNAVSKIVKLGTLAALVSGATMAYAGSTIRITNNSTKPWCLRISEEPTVPIMAQGSKDQAPVELSSQNHKLVYYIQPGDTCTLQFKDMQSLPLKQEVGLVDQSGTELSKLRLESQSAPMLHRVGNFLGHAEDDPIVTRISLSPQAPRGLRAESPESLSITADSCE